MRYFAWKLELVSNTLWRLSVKAMFCFLLDTDVFKLIFFDYFGNSKAFRTVLT